jgi:hypothetical protein
METIFCKCGHSINCHEHSGSCVITDERGYYACGCSLSPEQIAVEYTAARIAKLEAALKGIDRATIEWDANKLGGVHVQRKRWQRCGEIAREALEMQS